MCGGHVENWMPDTDNWEKSAAALRAAADSMGTAGSALGTAMGELGHAAATATIAGAEAAWSASAAGARAASDAALKSAYASLGGAENFVPTVIMFALALISFRILVVCCCGRCRLVTTTVAVPMLAALCAVPGLQVSLTALLVGALAAAKSAHPAAANAAAAVSTACDAVATHAMIETVGELAAAAHNASATFSALAREIIAANPQARAASASLESLGASPYIQSTLSHAHFPSFARCWLVLMAALVGWSMVRCCCGGGRRRRPPSQAHAEAKTAQRDSAAPAKSAKAGAAKASRAKTGGGSGGGGRGGGKGGGRMRGVGEGELRSDTELAGPSMLDLCLAPWRACARLVRSISSWWRLLMPASTGAVPSTGGGQRGRRPAVAMPGTVDDGEGVAAGGVSGGSGGGGAASSARATVSRPAGRGTADPAVSHPRLVATLKGFSEGVTSAALSQDGNLAAAVSSDRTMRVFSGLSHAGAAPLPTPLIANVKLDHGSYCSLSANGRNVVVATTTSKRLLAYTITPPGAKQAKAGLALRKEFPAGGSAHAKPMCAALLAPNSRFILSAGSEDDLTVKLWSPAGDLIAAVDNKQAAQHGASISADSKLVAIAGAAHRGPSAASRSVSPNHGQVRRAHSLAPKHAPRRPTPHRPFPRWTSVGHAHAIRSVGGLCLREARQPLFGPGRARQVSVYEVMYNGDKPIGLRLVLNVGGHTRGVTSVSFAQDCVHLALAALDGEWSVVGTDVRYDLKVAAREDARGKAPHAPFEMIALSPFAMRLVGATASASISIIDVASGRALETIEAGHGAVTALAYSFDGLRVLSGGGDGKLRLWRVGEDDQAGQL